MKRLICAAMILAMLACAVCGAAADTDMTQTAGMGGDTEALRERLLQVDDFKFRSIENGIGYGLCPVYSAPSYDSVRFGGGRAQCDTNDRMGEAGKVPNGWLMVNYETSTGAYRTGYIPKDYIPEYKSGMSVGPQFDYIPVRAEGYINVVESHLAAGSVFTVIAPGETFYVLGKYTYSGSWWYIECYVNGQQARGFIDRGTSSFYVGDLLVRSVSDLGVPAVSPTGSAQIGEVIVNAGERKNVRSAPGMNGEPISKVYPGTVYPCYGVATAENGKDWYYVWVEDDSEWGWVASASAELR